MKLKKLLEDIFPENDENKFDEQSFLENVKGYNSYGKSIYREGLSDTAKKLSEIAKNAGVHAVKETEDSFDKITVLLSIPFKPCIVDTLILDLDNVLSFSQENFK